MTQAQLVRKVASRTGETPALVRHLGFHLEAVPTDASLQDEIRLVVDCPSCRQPVTYPGRTRDGSSTLAECTDPRCDLFFDFHPNRVYAV